MPKYSRCDAVRKPLPLSNQNIHWSDTPSRKLFERSLYIDDYAGPQEQIQGWMLALVSAPYPVMIYFADLGLPV